VSLERLREQVDAFGPRPFLVTVGEGAAHVVSVEVAFDDDSFVVPAGRTSRQNAADHPSVTLLWPPTDGGPYSLIVDGTAEAGDGEQLVVRPGRAVLHRMAGADGDLPSCVPLEG
jgi:hypothetical protein